MLNVLLTSFEHGLGYGEAGTVGYGGQVPGGATLYDDLWFAKSARGALVTTYGTYSWIAAFLSRADAVHVPYTEDRAPQLRDEALQRTHGRDGGRR